MGAVAWGLRRRRRGRALRACDRINHSLPLRWQSQLCSHSRQCLRLLRTALNSRRTLEERYQIKEPNTNGVGYRIDSVIHVIPHDDRQ